MSTYLQLSQLLRQECGISGTGPAAVTSQTGENARLVTWVAAAWRDIQTRHENWRWMRRNCSITTTTDQGDYAYTAFTDVTDVAAISRFSRWLPYDDKGCSLFSIYQTSSGVAAERRLIYLPWDNFRVLYRFGTQTSSFPVHFSITPADKLALGPEPDATGYTVLGEYQMGTQELAANSDTPDMPSRFHNLIVYRGMMKYGAHESAGEVYADGASQFSQMMFALEKDQLHPITLGRSIA